MRCYVHAAQSSRKALSSSASQQIPRILFNPQFIAAFKSARHLSLF